MKAIGSLPCSRDPSMGPYPQTVDSTQLPHGILLTNSSEPIFTPNKDLKGQNTKHKNLLYIFLIL
jgi:hypothetical protein